MKFIDIKIKFIIITINNNALKDKIVKYENSSKQIIPKQK